MDWHVPACSVDPQPGNSGELTVQIKPGANLLDDSLLLRRPLVFLVCPILQLIR